ncbi:MAG: sulfatase family protein [Akkermansiaceae bacterium]
MKTILKQAAIFLLLFSSLKANTTETTTQEKPLPNIVIFLADDLGYGDLGCYGHPFIKTPNIDALAQSGVRLTDCHSGGTVCSPSRASLITGRNPYRSGFFYIAGPEGSHLRASEITLPTLLKQKGYDTCFVGKWHLGKFNNQPTPGDHGYDHWFATEVNAFDGPESPAKFVRNGTPIGEINQWYCEAIVEESIQWIKNRPDQTKPYLLIVSYHEPHTPIMPPKKYSDMYDNDFVEILEPTMPYGGVHRPLTRNISENKKYYYGTVSQLDNTVGTLMKEVDAHSDNSIVILTSDNGPETPVTVEESGNQWEDPIRDHCFGTPGPWRGMKRYVYEGGHRVPGIVRWKGTIKPGTISNQLVNGTDWLPTICAATGIQVPTDRTIDGTDVKLSLQGQPIKRTIPGCWIFPAHYDTSTLPGMSMRDGNYTIIGWFSPKTKEQGISEWVKSAKLQRFALFDLSKDTNQSNPLNNHFPEETERMKNKLIALWADIQQDSPDWINAPELKTK